ncbi:MAG: hypothetical protein NTZ48_00535 [Candidatus Omnitrophica bacterium]|nr:hypothetical protein [Candidatus Omnitrophota bacterium]
MENKNEEFQKEEMSGAVLLQKIKSGEINPRALKTEERQMCVGILILEEGLKQTHVAQLLCCAERTIRRDVDAINEKNGQKPSLELAEKQIGKMMVRAEIHISHLMRLARSQDGSLAEKAQAEYMAWRVLREMVEKMMTLGYLPSRPQAIVGNIFHHVESSDQDVSFPELKAMIVDIVATAKETNTLTPELEQEAESLKIKIEKTEVVSQVKNFKEKNPKKEEQNDK